MQGATLEVIRFQLCAIQISADLAANVGVQHGKHHQCPLVLMCVWCSTRGLSATLSLQRPSAPLLAAMDVQWWTVTNTAYCGNQQSMPSAIPCCTHGGTSWCPTHGPGTTSGDLPCRTIRMPTSRYVTTAQTTACIYKRRLSMPSRDICSSFCFAPVYANQALVPLPPCRTTRTRYATAEQTTAFVVATAL